MYLPVQSVSQTNHVLQTLPCFAGPPAKRQNLVMSFKHVGALNIRANFFVRPAAFDDVVQWVEEGLVVMVNPGTILPCHYIMCSCLPLYVSHTCCPLCVTVSSMFCFQVIGHRQAGKSTLVVMLAHHISEKQLYVGSTVLESIEICLNRNTPMVCFLLG